ncbi:hypothetical protein [Novosphingobium album (ex Liu et al. 2023)]|uniref:Preprotein translocase subunit YajC n=1 Tax=Novosphingobium album (ex Liu et al. 2023) TaxID=3031130 RepID=A0ABT5WXD5_9SPHN|nr:hypothetical protein [Novosphingobium album (ex Liu et al. 2023)]MDE8654542.1 hypothetical protein [Novosphingobium album (ex Liu et al. 2023)]
MKKTLIAAILAGASLSPVAALAQGAPAAAAPTPAVGAKVFGPDGAEAGTIEKIEGGNIVVNTGTHRATLPAAAFGNNETGLLISMTKAQLDAAVSAAEAQASASMDSALVADAPIKSSDGVLVGSIQKVEGDNVTVNLAEGNAITLKKEFLMADASGLKLKMSDADFKSAVAAATGSASAQADANAKGGSGEEAAATEPPGN